MNSPSERPKRKPRADAERNRQRLLDVAYDMFAARGTAASLEEIARTAGVGIGTLYRHFPTRDALVAEVYRNALAQLAQAAERLSATRAPVDALREWLLLFVDYLATKKLMADALNAMAGGTASLYAESGPQLRNSVALLTDRAVAEGAIRLTVDPLDLLRAIAAMAGSDPEDSWQAGAREMVHILVAGLRTDRGSSAGTR